MKRNLLICLFLMTILIDQSFGQWSCNVVSPTWSFSSCTVIGNRIFFNYGDTAKVTMQCSCNSSMCACQTQFWASVNGVTIYMSAYTFGIIDTGLVLLHFVCWDAHSGCDDGIQDTLYASYNSNAVSEITAQNDFIIYPANSHGLFKIKSKAEVRRLMITDVLGKTVFFSNNPIAEINLSFSANGIYFYAIEDKNGSLYRGKIMK